jgi:hypothetical protein
MLRATALTPILRNWVTKEIKSLRHEKKLRDRALRGSRAQGPRKLTSPPLTFGTGAECCDRRSRRTTAEALAAPHLSIDPV